MDNILHSFSPSCLLWWWSQWAEELWLTSDPRMKLLYRSWGFPTNIFSEFSSILNCIMHQSFETPTFPTPGVPGIITSYYMAGLVYRSVARQYAFWLAELPVRNFPVRTGKFPARGSLQFTLLRGCESSSEEAISAKKIGELPWHTNSCQWT